MKLFTGKRVGQSSPELAAAVFFSFLIHTIILFAAVFLYMNAAVRAILPPVYQVALVNPMPTEAPPIVTPLPGIAPAVPKKIEPPKASKPAAKVKKAAPKKSTAPAKKIALPELSRPKTEPVKQLKETAEPLKPGTAVTEHPAGPVAPAAPAAKSEAVAVAAPQQDFKFPPYLAIIREKVEQHWNPPPGEKGMKVKVQFRLLRSGRVGDSNLEKSSGNFYFDQAAMRAILSSSPFPPLPDEFPKESAVFAVDLMSED